MINSLSCDLLIRIKNASRSGKVKITAPLSKFSLNILSLLKKHKFISDYQILKDEKLISIDNPHLIDIKIISTPGRHIYCTSNNIPWGNSPTSLIIISTSAGLFSQKEAVAKKIGGEIIAEIW